MPKIKGLEVKNKTENQAELYIYGDIVSDSDWKWDESEVMPKDILNFSKEIEGIQNIDIYINSGGGSVFAGMAIYHMLKRLNANITVHVDGVAASIASVIALAGNKVIIPKNAYFMIHKAWNYQVGNADDMREMADTLDKIDEGILNVYADNLREGVSIDEIKEFIKNETWFTGEEASKYFNIDVIEEVSAAAASSEYYAKYQNAPTFKNEISPPQSKTVEDEQQAKINKLRMELEIL